MNTRIIVKIGTSVITENGGLSESVVGSIVDQVAVLKKSGVEAIIITSGAVATGRKILSAKKNGDSIAEKQVYAAVGQVGLMSVYAKLFEKHALQCAQILVTKEDFRDRQHYANMKHCFENLLQENIVPVVNENDPIAITELLFTDNDELAGLIAAQLNADAVIMLTSVEGVLDSDGKAISEITSKTVSDMEAHIKETKSASGRGGMRTKFDIAKRLMAQGIATYIVDGKREKGILAVVEGQSVGTKFVPEKKLSAVKRRLAYSDGLSTGAVYVDTCAEDILRSKKSVSLLPVGITKVEGAFKKGDVIEIRAEKGTKLGFGIAEYDAGKAAELKGKKGGKELIHYDHLLIG